MAAPATPLPATLKPPPRPPVFDRRRLLALPLGRDRRGYLAGMRIRKKLIVLHTLFSGALALVLLLALRPAIREVVERAEVGQARELLELAGPLIGPEGAASGEAIGRLGVRSGTAAELGIDAGAAISASANPWRAIDARTPGLGHHAVLYTPARAGTPERFHTLAVQSAGARRAVTRLYVLVVIALLAVYGLVAVALEVLVLPQSVYDPIRRMLGADAAVREGRKGEELIPAGSIPDDELGEIMRSRNESIVQLRRQEAALAEALSQLERAANDLKRKNHLLETAQRNLAHSDRLASLGMMSAGIAHELNTPLAVLKGLVERLDANPRAGMEPVQSALMRRVVGRLERLGESLLDFARARPATVRRVGLAGLVAEAITLVTIDRESARIALVNDVPASLTVACDADRMVQVLVNLIRNAVDAVRGTRDAAARGETLGMVRVEAGRSRRDGGAWVVLTVTDDGPGIDAAVLPHLFEPFVSTRLDARGTGLGLAVAEGIVKEHGGVLLARNRPDGGGAVFEVTLPDAAEAGDGAAEGLEVPSNVSGGGSYEP